MDVVYKILLCFLIVYILVFPFITSGQASYTVDINDTISYSFISGFNIVNSTLIANVLDYSYVVDFSIGEAWRFIRCLGWSAWASVVVNNTLFNRSYVASCYVAPPSAGVSVVRISPPGLFTPEGLFTLLLFITVMILFSKLIDPFTAFAIASATMMIISILYFRSIELFFMFLFGLVFALGIKYYAR